MKTKTAEEIAFDLASAAIDMMALHSPHTEQMMREAIERWKAWQLNRKERKPEPPKERPEFCPHAEPFVYCDGCKADPCPMGLESKKIADATAVH